MSGPIRGARVRTGGARFVDLEGDDEVVVTWAAPGDVDAGDAVVMAELETPGPRCRMTLGVARELGARLLGLDPGFAELLSRSLADAMLVRANNDDEVAALAELRDLVDVDGSITAREGADLVAGGSPGRRPVPVYVGVGTYREGLADGFPYIDPAPTPHVFGPKDGERVYVRREV